MLRTLKFHDVDQWLALVKRQIPCDIAPYQVQDAANCVIKIKPFIADCRDVMVAGRDWIPVLDSGDALLEQMVHSPSLYLPKAKNIRRQGGEYVADFGPITDCPGESILVGGSPNYYHWLIDYLPRLLLAERYADIDNLRVVVNKPLAPFQRESLALLCVDDHQILEVGDTEAVRAEAIIVPSLLVSTTVPHPCLPPLLRETFPQRRHSTCKRVYLSRQDATTRKLTNEPALISLLARYGFERFLPAELGFQEQIDLCYGAEALVAVHGAAMANVVFCPATAKVFEIFTPNHRVTSMYMLSRTCKRDHRFVPARNVTFGEDGNPLLGNWEVDLDAMEFALKAGLV
jgi:capsular polysaccharide biosynthesis protein